MTGLWATSALFPAGGSFTVDGVHSDAFGMYYRSWAYDVVPTIRSAMVDIPGRRGKIDNGSEMSSRLLTMDLTIADVDPPTRWRMMHAWAAAINPETGPHAIEFIDENPGWRLWCQPAGGTASPDLITSQWTQSFEAADPHWYTPYTFPTYLLFPGSPQYGTVVNYGNTFSEALVKVSPQSGSVVTNPVITVASQTVVTSGNQSSLTTVNQTARLFGTITWGEEWIIDSYNKIVTRNGVSDINNFSGSFLTIPGSAAGYAAGGLSTLVQWQDGYGQGGNAQFFIDTRLL